jgi:hypothetical protein
MMGTPLRRKRIGRFMPPLIDEATTKGETDWSVAPSG